MNNLCNCGSIFNEKRFFSKIIYHCDSCFTYKIVDISCEHDYVPVSFVISGGSTQIRLFCRKCYQLDPKPKKKSDFKNIIIPCKDLDDYKKFIDELEKPFQDELNRIREIHHESFNERYINYINSNEWKLLRDKVLERDEYICQICHRPAIEVHHLTYAHLAKEFLFELISLCSDCHKIEYHKDKT